MPKEKKKYISGVGREKERKENIGGKKKGWKVKKREREKHIGKERKKKAFIAEY